MRRADRLFRLVQLLRKQRVVTAQRLAEALEVSERTVYRDVRDLSLSGVPIRGEAGVGYALAKGFDLPPMTLTNDELEALVLGVRVVQRVGDPALARAAGSLLAKVELVLPDTLRPGLVRTRLAAPLSLPTGRLGPLGLVREALRSQRRLRFAYLDEAARGSTREVRPLTLAFWGSTWTLGAWCELRRDFRSFRADRLRDAELARPFETEPGKTLDDFILAVERRDAAASARRGSSQ